MHPLEDMAEKESRTELSLALVGDIAAVSLPSIKLITEQVETDCNI